MSATTTTTPSTVSNAGPKVSKFAAKSGFVIPKNKLSGSLVPVFKGAKKNDAMNEGEKVSGNDDGNKVLRKTKWGPDLSLDASVKRGRALAYQTRVDHIAQQLESGSLEAEKNQVLDVAAENADQKSSNPQVDREKLEHLELEKQEVIGEIVKLNPSYKTPPDYKPLLKEAVVPIPVKEYPGYNFLGLIFGPATDTQKRLEEVNSSAHAIMLSFAEETGTIIKVYGAKADTGEKVEISTSDANVQSTYEELHINISADSYEKVDAATDLIELLVTSVSGSLAAISTSTLVSGENVNAFSQSQGDGAQFLVPNAFVNQGVPQPVGGQLQTSLHGQFQSQIPWFPSGLPQNPMHPLNTSASILTNPVNTPSLFGHPPTAATRFPSILQMPSLVPPSSQPQMQVPPSPYMPQVHSGPPRIFPVPALQASSIQSTMPGSHPFAGIQPQPTGPLHIGRPSMASLPQAPSSIAPRPLPDRLLTPGSSTGWSGAPANAAASLGSSNTGQLAPTMGPPQGSRPVFASAPHALGGTSPAFPAALRPTQVPGSAHTPVQPSPHVTMASSPVISISRPTMPAGTSGSFSGSITNFSMMNLSSATAPRPPPHPSSGDFTFQPHRPQNPSPLTVPRPSGMLPTQSTRAMGQMPAPQSPSFRMGAPNTGPQHIMQVPRPQVGNQMGQPHAHHVSAGPFVRNPNAAFAKASPVSPAMASQMGPRSFGPGPQMHYPPGPFSPRPANPLPRNYPALPNRPESHMGLNQQFSNNRAGGPQIYDPFSPTSTSVPPQRHGANLAQARKPENDPEYEDLMASVGVK